MVIVVTVCIAVEFIDIRQVAPICTSSNTWFIGPREFAPQTVPHLVQAVFAGLSCITNTTETDMHSNSSHVALSVMLAIHSNSSHVSLSVMLAIQAKMCRELSLDCMETVLVTLMRRTSFCNRNVLIASSKGLLAGSKTLLPQYPYWGCQSTCVMAIKWLYICLLVCFVLQQTTLCLLSNIISGMMACVRVCMDVHYSMYVGLVVSLYSRAKKLAACE